MYMIKEYILQLFVVHICHTIVSLKNLGKYLLHLYLKMLLFNCFISSLSAISKIKLMLSCIVQY